MAHVRNIGYHFDGTPALRLISSRRILKRMYLSTGKALFFDEIVTIGKSQEVLRYECRPSHYILGLLCNVEQSSSGMP